MAKEVLIAVYTTNNELVPLKFIESIREIADLEQLTVNKLADETEIEIRTLSGKEHTVKGSQMKPTVEEIAGEEMTHTQTIAYIVNLWLRSVSDQTNSHPFL